jgi:hypothetical protein
MNEIYQVLNWHQFAPENGVWMRCLSFYFAVTLAKTALPKIAFSFV